MGKQIEERIYSAPVDPQAIMDLCKVLDAEKLNTPAVTQAMIGDKPNTYTFTKALAMNLGAVSTVIKLAKQMKHLASFVDVSTAYCNCDLKQIEGVFWYPGGSYKENYYVNRFFQLWFHYGPAHLV